MQVTEASLPSITSQRWRYRLALLAALAIPSLDIVHKYTGLVGLLLFIPYVLILIVLSERASVWLQPPQRRAWCNWLGAAALLGIVVLFAVLFPIANVHVPDHGSDTDEAYDLAVRALLDGRYPYYDLTYLGNRIHHLPGALLLATPFVLLGTSALQNLFWTAAWLLLLLRALQPPRGLALFLLMFAASPVLMHQIVTGSDGVMSGISVLAATWLFTHAWQQTSNSAWQRYGALLLLALALSNRPNFAPVVVSVLAFVWHRHGVARVLLPALWLGVLLALINLPFYLYDPAGFAPLEGLDRVTRFDDLLPHAGQLLPLAAFVLALGLATRNDADTFAGVALASGLVQALLVVSGLLLSCIAGGELDLAYAAYGCYFLFPLGYWCWSKLNRV
ncbi:MAG TPA: hypothetical protein VMH83_03545 [Candidatus Acidoferrum sp.]|nr:hypothetical protein [Candidatus Acidoferrum sp.]